MQHLAGIFVLVSLVASIVLGGVMKLLPPVVLGTLTGWLYLRFLQVKGEGALKCAADLCMSRTQRLQF